MNQTFKEFKIYSFRRGEKGVYEKDKNGFFIPEDEKQTELGFVRITQHEADINNSYMNSRKMRYELVPEKVELTEREILINQANELGLEFPKNISSKKLKELIDTI